MIINDKFKQGNLHKFTNYISLLLYEFLIAFTSFDVTLIALQVSSSFQW